MRRQGLRAITMHPGLLPLVHEYLATVARAVDLLLVSGFQRQGHRIVWPHRDRPKPLRLAGGVAYIPHGIGFVVELQPHPIDFDLGPWGEIDRFDLFRLHNFSRGRRAEFGLPVHPSLDTLVDEAVREGHLGAEGGLFFLPARDAGPAPGSGPHSTDEPPAG